MAWKLLDERTGAPVKVGDTVVDFRGGSSVVDAGIGAEAGRRVTYVCPAAAAVDRACDPTYDLFLPCRSSRRSSSRQSSPSA